MKNTKNTKNTKNAKIAKDLNNITIVNGTEFDFVHVMELDETYTLKAKDDVAEVSWTFEDGGKVVYGLETPQKHIDSGVWKVTAVRSKLPKSDVLPSFVKLTQQMKAKVIDSNTLEITTKMTVAGGGGRNIITWALLASKLGYTVIDLKTPDASGSALDAIIKAVGYANDMLNHLGVTVVIVK